MSALPPLLCGAARRTSRHTATASAGRAGGALLRHGYNPPTRFRRDASIVRRLRNATPPLLVCLLLTTPLLGRLAVDAAALPALVDPALLHGMSLGVLLLLGGHHLLRFLQARERDPRNLLLGAASAAALLATLALPATALAASLAATLAGVLLFLLSLWLRVCQRRRIHARLDARRAEDADRAELAGQGQVPRPHQPRGTHPAQRRAGDDRAAPRHAAVGPPARLRADHPQRRQRAAGADQRDLRHQRPGVRRDRAGRGAVRPARAARRLPGNLPRQGRAAEGRADRLRPAAGAAHPQRRPDAPAPGAAQPARTRLPADRRGRDPAGRRGRAGRRPAAAPAHRRAGQRPAAGPRPSARRCSTPRCTAATTWPRAAWTATSG